MELIDSEENERRIVLACFSRLLFAPAFRRRDRGLLTGVAARFSVLFLGFSHERERRDSGGLRLAVGRPKAEAHKKPR
jgi:hypothetical protein